MTVWFCKIARWSRLLRTKGIIAFKGDWTKYDPAITQALASFGRNSIPVYVYYPPGADTPVILPQLITPNMILERIKSIINNYKEGVYVKNQTGIHECFCNVDFGRRVPLLRKWSANQAAPNFTLTDSNGQKHSLSDYKGKFVVLEWFNPDCPFVKKHYNSGNMPRLQKEYTAKGVIWLSIDSSAPGKQGSYTPQGFNKFIADKGAAPTAFLLDTDGKVGHLYGAQTTPDMYVINPQGILIYQGAIDDTPGTDLEDVKTAKNYVRAALDEAMNGKPVAVSTPNLMAVQSNIKKTHGKNNQFSKYAYQKSLALREASSRRERGLTIIDGAREIERAFDAGIVLDKVFYVKGSMKGFVKKLSARKTESIEVTEKLMEKLAYGNRHEGIIAIAQTPLDIKRSEIIAQPLVVVLESLEKPGNLGAVLRTCDGVGLRLFLFAIPRPICIILMSFAPAQGSFSNSCCLCDF